MAEGIFHRPGPVTVELVLHRPERLRAGSDRAIETSIHVLDIEMKAHGGSSNRLRATVAHVRKLVRQHDGRAIDFDFRVPDGAVRPVHPHALRSTEHFLIAVSYTHLRAHE